MFIQSEGILAPHDIQLVRTSYKSHLESELAKVPSYVPDPESPSMLKNQWTDIVWPTSSQSKESLNVEVDTGVGKDILKHIGKASVWVPEGFEVHSKLGRHIKNRLGSLEKEKGIDFATAEVCMLFCMCQVKLM